MTSSASRLLASPPARVEPSREAPAWRLEHQEDNGLAEFIAHAKYVRYRPELGRWESFREAVERVHRMHRDVFAERLGRRLEDRVGPTPADPADQALLRDELAGATLGEVVARAFAAVAEKRVLPSMRSLQFGGEAIRRNHARIFNCAFSTADRIDFFREYFFLLLAGVGCGFSVQHHHVSRLPPIPRRGERGTMAARGHCVADSIEGWADALDVLLRSYFEGFTANFDFGGIRSCGEPLRTAGGFAPGPEPLQAALAAVEALLHRAAGRQLRPIEVYDLCMFVSRAVLSGSRRAASICLFSPDDVEMMEAKTGAWLVESPQRSACNNSAVLSRTATDEAQFRRLFAAQREFGEPGFYFSADPDYGCNPCGETGLHPVLVGPLERDVAERLAALGYAGELRPEASWSGWEMCNLTTINGAVAQRPEEFFRACVHAAVIGTLQAAYTDLAYLGPVTRALNERDALLGVSICGFMDNPGLLFAPRILERGARICRATNELVAAVLGIRRAARVTCVKPEGTASLLLGAAPGIHPRPARHYLRRVEAERSDPVFRQFQAANPQFVETSRLRPATDDIIVFPVEAPPHAIVREEIGAVEFLERVLLVQQHWVLAGEAPDGRSPGLHHNVSHTCAVRPDEWDAVADFIWAHRARFTGVALLGDDAAARYAQPPFEAVRSEADAAFWNKLHYHAVDYSRAPAPQVDPAALQAGACVAGACDV